MMSIPVIWIDTDTGVDDALALICAAELAKQGELILAGVSAACGNVEQEKTFENARNILYLAGKEEIPVYPGAKAPLKRKLRTAKHVHGENGLGGCIIETSPAKRQTKPAWDALYDHAKALHGELELVLVGPMTNAAIAFREHPDLVDYVKRILIMGGALEGGNITPNAEFNIYADPEAAQEIFALKLPVVLFGLDVTMKTLLLRQDIDEIEAGDNEYCALFREATKVPQSFYRKNVGEVYCCHDACPVIYSVYPELFQGITANIRVETDEGTHLGQTIPVVSPKASGGNVLVMTQVDRERFAEIMKTLLCRQ